ncbi:hypothetical protein EBR66_03130 [bacterium]|nr:hypothetical protein [bacterium]
MQARVYHGDERNLPSLLDLLSCEGIVVHGPDFSLTKETQLSIDTARELCARASGKPFVEARRTFVIVCSAITNEAQHALLKTLEEPPHDALFIFLFPLPHLLLPTIHSRVRLETLPVAVSDTTEAHAFSTGSVEKRIEIIKELLDGEKDMRKIDAFLSDLERILADSPDKEKSLPALYRTRIYVHDKGALLKPLLEQLALLIP